MALRIERIRVPFEQQVAPKGGEMSRCSTKRANLHQGASPAGETFARFMMSWLKEFIDPMVSQALEIREIPGKML